MIERMTEAERIAIGPDDMWSLGSEEDLSEDFVYRYTESIAKNRSAVLAEPYLHIDEVSLLLAIPVSKVARYHRHSQILGYTDHDTVLFPAFQFDTDTPGNVHPICSAVHQASTAFDHSWQMTGWWLTPNLGIYGTPAPKELIGTNKANILVPIVKNLIKATLDKQESAA